MADKGDIEDYQAALGFAISEYDLQLQELERVLYNSDRNPDMAWVTAITTRFPWLSGVVLTDDLGVPRAKIPPDFPKPFTIGSLLEVDEKQQLKELRAFVQHDPLGPEIYVGNPVYYGADFRGVIVAHFDPRALLARTGDPAHVVIAGPEGVIWPGRYAVESLPLSKVDWSEETRKNHTGVVRNEHGAFYWVSRYLGNLPLVYAIRIQGEFPVRDENLRDLTLANNFAVGPVSFAGMAPPAGTPEEITPDGNLSPLTVPDPGRTVESAEPLAQ